jgi:hypothetical protein
MLWHHVEHVSVVVGASTPSPSPAARKGWLYYVERHTLQDVTARYAAVICDENAGRAPAFL